MTVKKIVGILHLWLGLASGLVIFIVCITAAIWSFSPEIENLTQAYRSTPEQDKPFLPVSLLKANAEKHMPGKKPTVFPWVLRTRRLLSISMGKIIIMLCMQILTVAKYSNVKTRTKLFSGM